MGVMSLELYLVTCDLLADGDYASLKQRLRTLGAAQVLNNQWALRTTHSAAQLKEILKQLVDDGDRIVVTEVGAEWASRRAMANLGAI
jgi:phosphoserine phosphatase